MRSQYRHDLSIQLVPDAHQSQLSAEDGKRDIFRLWQQHAEEAAAICGLALHSKGPPIREIDVPSGRLYQNSCNNCIVGSGTVDPTKSNGHRAGRAAPTRCPHLFPSAPAWVGCKRIVQTSSALKNGQRQHVRTPK